MIFTPYPDEVLVINKIQKIRNDSFTLLRLTDTMIEKNNIDANVFFRALLSDNNIVDYMHWKTAEITASNSKAN